MIFINAIMEATWKIGSLWAVVLCVILLVRSIHFKWTRKCHYLLIVGKLDIICSIICLIGLVGNVVYAIQGSIACSASMLIMSILCYTSMKRILCFENEEIIFIGGKLLDKAKIYIDYNKQNDKNNIIVLKNEENQVLISIAVSQKGKELLYNLLR